PASRRRRGCRDARTAPARRADRPEPPRAPVRRRPLRRSCSSPTRPRGKPIRCSLRKTLRGSRFVHTGPLPAWKLWPPMGSTTLVLVIVIAAAVSFDFTNGFHDTANAMATSIATGALKPIVAVLISAALNFLGAFISIAVATTIAKGILPTSATAGVDGLFVVEAALIGAITWNLITWYFTIPSSSSHALIGGLGGAGIASIRLAPPGRPR